MNLKDYCESNTKGNTKDAACQVAAREVLGEVNISRAEERSTIDQYWHWDAMKAAVVCTIALPLDDDNDEAGAGVHLAEAAKKVLTSFLRHYQKLGFGRIFVFFDQLEVCENHSLILLCKAVSVPEDGFYVHCFRRGDREILRDQQHVCTLYKALATPGGAQDGGELAENDVPSRQRINVEYALYLASQKTEFAAKWILHVDLDELFVLPDGIDLSEHLLQLEERSIGACKYVNHEGVPEQDHIENFLEDISLFKMNHLILPMRADVGLAMKAWANRTDYGQYFLAYDNGKSMVRALPGILPISVHSFSVPAYYNLRQVSNFRDLRDASHEFDKDIASDYSILHFPVGGLEWLEWKYHQLGDFQESWRVNSECSVPIAPCFHLSCKRSMASCGHLQDIFKSQAKALDDVEAQLAVGVCFRVNNISTQEKETGGSVEIACDEFHQKQKSCATDKTLQEQGSMITSARENEVEAHLSYDKAWLLNNIARDFL